jgi:hypothetical protein
MFRPLMPATRANDVCFLTLAPAGCLKLWLLMANVCAWGIIILTIYEKIL